MRRILWVLLLGMLILSGCQDPGHVEIDPEMPALVVIDPKPFEQGLLEEALSEKALLNGMREQPVREVGTHPLFSGVRPLAVMLDNHYLARPQSGLEDARVVFEILAEGPITRYMALIPLDGSTDIGPVRSARPYFLALAMGFDSLYVHAGGSVAALDMIVSEEVDNLNGLRAGSGVFWRESHRNMPHNLYTSTDALSKDIDRLDYSVTTDAPTAPLQYDRGVSPEGGESTTNFSIVYKAPTAGDPVGYTIDYRYDGTNRRYTRFVNGIPQVDETTRGAIDAGSILVIAASHRVIDAAGRREIGIIGNGEGFYLTMGQRLPIVWEKPDASSPMTFRYLDGTEVIVNPGRLFIQVVDKLSRMSVHEE